MLVICRKDGESFTIGTGPEAVTVTVFDSRPGRVRLGIEAPKSVPILRSEVPDRKQP